MAQSSTEHKGHRKRTKEKFLNFGPEIFSEHELLEILLYYAIPQKDTNPIAHKLLDKFGSIAGVMDAPFDLLVESGLSENTAFLLKFIPDIAIIYRDQKFAQSEYDDILQYIKDRLVNLYLNKSKENIYIIFLNIQMKIISSRFLCEGNQTSTELDINKICSLAIKSKAKSVVISHNHPSGDLSPSDNDIISTIYLRNALKTIDVHLLDHILVANDKCLSFYENNLFYDDIESYNTEKERLIEELIQEHEDNYYPTEDLDEDLW